MLTLFFVCFACLGTLRSQEVVNAFDDLKRTGQIQLSASEMTQPASPQQIQALKAEQPKGGYFCFTEDRLHDIRTSSLIPQRWIDRPKVDRTVFQGEALPDEFYVWQIGVYAPFEPLNDLTVTFSDLKNEQGEIIPKRNLRCFNMGGTNDRGKSFVKRVSVPLDSVQPLWIGVDIPALASGRYAGEATVHVRGKRSTKIEVRLTVGGNAIALQGDGEGWRKSRLRWLDGRIGAGDGPTAPYTPVTVSGDTIHYLGGTVVLSASGLPAQITTRYDQYNQLSADVANRILAGEMCFEIETEQGIEALKPGKIKMDSVSGSGASWSVVQSSRSFRVTCRGQFEFDGSTRFWVTVKALKNRSVKDIRLIVPYRGCFTRYRMGLGLTGGSRTEKQFEWKWNTDKHQDKFWMGDVNAGLNICFKDRNYVRPLVNIYYSLGKLNLPVSWGNENKGGVRFAENESSDVRMVAFSGEREMMKNDLLDFGFDLLITPVKPIDLNHLAQERFFHKNSDLSTDYIRQAGDAGANYINIHHKKDIYPFINYPYSDESVSDLKAFVSDAHQQNIGVRVYYTTRELTVKVPELWALRSLGSEVIHDGPGEKTRTLIHPKGPNAWLNENLSTHFIPAWFNAFNEGRYKGDMDISVITTPDSRWNNYYLEGLGYLVNEVGIDGVYIDDSALDRETLKRSRRILDADGKRRLIDIHSWNHFNRWAGFANSIHLYLDLLPYVDRTWLGEGFSAQNSPDFWLVEMSGIPFGLTSETLDARNLYRGMIFGMLPRLGWSGNPLPLWRLWDDFGMKDARMCGWWSDSCAVHVSNEQLLVTTFVQPEKALVVIANWNDQEQSGQLQVDTRLLGFIPSKISQPAVDGFQSGDAEDLTIGGKGGLILLLEK